MKEQPNETRGNVFVNSVVVAMLCIAASYSTQAQCNCDPLPAPGANETVVYANNTTQLLNEIGNASGPTTIYLNSGSYQVSTSVFISIDKPYITIRSTSGNRDDVIIEGQGMDASGIGMGVYVDADNVTVADLTVREVQNHGFFVNPGSDNCLFHNVRGVDCGEQIFKASGYASLPAKNDGIIQCSTFEYTTTLDDGDDGWYTNGIDLLNCHGWIIRDCVIRNIKHNPSLTSNLAGPAILIWHGSSNTIVERCEIIECDFGISFGNAGQSGVSHTGGIIRNNFVLGYSESDFGIGLIYAPNAKVINNTVYSPGGWNWGIEARFSQTSGCVIMNNLCDEPIWPDRDGASCNTSTNIVNATSNDFVSVSTGDLHLANGSVAAIDAGIASPDRSHDIDCGSIFDSPDIGADEYGSITSLIDISSPADDIEMFPQPTNGLMMIKGHDIRHVYVHDNTGRLVLEYDGTSDGALLDLSSEAPGAYILMIVKSNGAVTRQVVKR